jgi:hypothetical protein
MNAIQSDPGMEEFITHLLYQGHYARGLHLLTEINQLEPRNLLRFDIYAPCLAICRTYISDSKRYPRFYETGATSGAGTANSPGAHHIFKTDNSDTFNSKGFRKKSLKTPNG